MSFTHALLLLFIALKLTGFIDWSWWLVLGPAWFLVAVCIYEFIWEVEYDPAAQHPRP